MRVEHLATRAGVPVDTVRYYQSKGLLDPPRREGRIAWYDEGHLARLSRIRELQQRGFTLATIARLVSGELDAADEALLGELSGLPPTGPGGTGPAASAVTGPDGGHLAGPRTYTLTELAAETAIPLALLKAVEAEGLLVPRRIGGVERYTDDDVAAAGAGLLLLEWGIPLPALLDLARLHRESTEAVALQAVDLFSRFVREPLREDGASRPAARRSVRGGTPEGPEVDRLLQAYAELLPAVTTLVAHHFTRTLVKAALDHVEQVGSAAERRAIRERIVRDGFDGVPPVDRTAAGQ